MTAFSTMTGYRATTVVSFASGTTIKSTPSNIGTIILGPASSSQVRIRDGSASGAILGTYICDGVLPLCFWAGLRCETGIYVEAVAGTPSYIIVHWQ